MNRVFEFLRFLGVGVLNTLIDWSVLDALLWLTGRQEEKYYLIFKSLSFICAVVFSYFMNKFFVFRKQDKGVKNEFPKFIAISIFSLILNVSAAFFGRQFCEAQLGQHLFILCANLGALTGTVLTVISNYLGYKFLVFKK